MAEREIETASMMRIQQLCCEGIKKAHEDMEKTRRAIVTLHEMRALEQEVDIRIRDRDLFTDNRKDTNDTKDTATGDPVYRNWGELNARFYNQITIYNTQTARFANASQTAGVYRTSDVDIGKAFADMKKANDQLKNFSADNTGTANVFDLQALIAKNAVGLIQRQNGVEGNNLPAVDVFPGLLTIGASGSRYAATHSSLQSVPLASVPFMGTGALSALYDRVLVDYNAAFAGAGATWRHANGAVDGANPTSPGVAIFTTAYRPLEIVVRRWDNAYMGVINWNNPNTALTTAWGVANAYQASVGGAAVTQADAGNYMTVAFTANMAMDLTPYVEINPLDTGNNGAHIINYGQLSSAYNVQLRAAYRSINAGFALSGNEATTATSRRLYNLNTTTHRDDGVGYNQINFSRPQGSTVWTVGGNGIANTENGVFNTELITTAIHSYNIKFIDSFSAMGWVYRELLYSLNTGAFAATALQGISLSELIAARDAAFRNGEEYNFIPPALFAAISQARNEATTLINRGMLPIDSSGGWTAAEADNNLNGHAYMLSKNKIDHALKVFDDYYEAYRITMKEVLDLMYESAKEEYFGIAAVDAARIKLARAIPNLDNVGVRRFFETSGAILENMRPGFHLGTGTNGAIIALLDATNDLRFVASIGASASLNQFFLAWSQPFSQAPVATERAVRGAYNELLAAMEGDVVESAGLGDITGTGRIDTDDAIQILKFVAGLESVLDDMTEEEALAVADVNKDGKIDADDAIAILKHVAEIELIGA